MSTTGNNINAPSSSPAPAPSPAPTPAPLPTSTQPVSTTQNAPTTVDISNTAFLEYLDIVQREYENERTKKQSFETRAGLILALLGALCSFLFGQVPLTDIFSLMTSAMTFLIFAKIASGLLVYGGCIFTMLMIIRTITVQKHDNFEVQSIDYTLLAEPRHKALGRIIFTYRDIIVQHRKRNELRAKDFRKSLYGVSVILIAAIVYMSIAT